MWSKAVRRRASRRTQEAPAAAHACCAAPESSRSLAVAGGPHRTTAVTHPVATIAAAR